jgi:hypothetical protein
MSKAENYQHVQNKIENEGLGYFLLDYCRSDWMPSKEGEILFDEAVKALEAFENFVNEQAEMEKENG